MYRKFHVDSDFINRPTPSKGTPHFGTWAYCLRLLAFPLIVGVCQISLSILPVKADAESGLELEQTNPADIPFEGTLDFGDSSFIETEEKLLEIDFQESSLEHIIYEVARRCDLNVVFPHIPNGEKVAFYDEKITLKLKKVTWRQIYSVLLDPYGFTFVEDRNVITLRTYKQLQQEPVFWETYKIKYRKASGMIPILKTVLQKYKGSDSIADEGQNLLIVQGTEQAHGYLKRLIPQLDKPANTNSTQAQKHTEE